MAKDAEALGGPWEQTVTASVSTTCVLLVSMAFFSENILLISVAIYVSFDQSQIQILQRKVEKNTFFMTCFGIGFVVCV